MLDFLLLVVFLLVCACAWIYSDPKPRSPLARVPSALLVLALATCLSLQA